MCGISGIYTRDLLTDANIRVENMLTSLKHRGPDGEKILNYKDKVIFGHTRLAIIDITYKSNQPMESERYIVTFNGEIYNYKQIREELDYDFKSDGDAEVILASIELKGINWFLEKANGMYAIAIFDKKTKKTLLLRDRFGIKPLYYYLNSDCLIFASEIKAILNSGLIKAELFEDAIDDYLGYRYVREPYTFFKNIFQVESGMFIVVNEDLTSKKYRYYNLPNHRKKINDYDNEELLIDELNEKINQVIERWSVADVEIGAYLSGGVDSSLVATILAEKIPKLNTYTIGFIELNEFKYAQQVARLINSDHHTIQMTKDQYLSLWHDLIYFNDGPLGVPNEIALAFLSKKIAEKLKVVISGEGADELFAGYGRIFRSNFEYQKENSKHPFSQYLINEYEYVPRKLRDKYLTVNKSLRKIFDQKIKIDFDNFSNEENIFRFFHNYHIKGLLKRVDYTSMYASVEARPPFLDHELIKYSYENLPIELKIRWNSKSDEQLALKESVSKYSEKRDTPKYILKRVSERYLPKNIIYRKKVGFPIPLHEWIDDIKELALEYLIDAKWIQKEKIEDLIGEAEINERFAQILWMFINVEMFIRKYFDKDWRY